MSKRTVGNSVKLQDGIPIIMKVIDLMSQPEAGGEMGLNKTCTVEVRSGRVAKLVVSYLSL